MNDEWEFFENNFACPICGSSELVLSIGPKTSKILVVGEHPEVDDVKQGKPMVGNMGRVLRSELSYLGFDLKSARRTNLWRHPPNKKKECLLDGINEVVKEAQGKQAILLLGDEVVKVFLDKSVTKVAGLLSNSNYFSAQIVVSCPNPAMMYHQGKGVGEIRLALKKFVKYLEEYNVLDNRDSNSPNIGSDWD